MNNLGPGVKTAYESQKYLSLVRQLEIRLKCIMPMLTRDNDELQLLDIENGVVKVRMKGAWEQGSTAKATLKKIIEIQLRQKFPEIKSVELSA